MKRWLKVSLSLLVILLLVLVMNLWGADQAVELQSILPEIRSSMDDLQKWSKQENWVWGQISKGKTADLAVHYAGSKNPKDEKDWIDVQELTSEFIETILLQEPYRSLIKHQGVCISGAWFKDKLDLSNANIKHVVRFEYSRFDEDVNMFGLVSSHLLSFDDSSFNRKLILESTRLSSYLYMRKGKFTEVNLNNARIENTVDMSQSEFLGIINLSSAQIGGNLLMQLVEGAKEVYLNGTTAKGAVNMGGSKLDGFINMDSITVDRHLFIIGGAEFKDATLVNAKVGGNLDMSNSKFSGSINLSSINVEGHLNIRYVDEFKALQLEGSSINGTVSLFQSKFLEKLNMKRMRIGRCLLMEQGRFQEVNLADLDLVEALEMSGAEFKGKLDMNSIHVGSQVHMERSAFDEVDLTGAEIDDTLHLSNSKLNGPLYMNRIHVGGDIYMDNAEFNEVSLSNAVTNGFLKMDQTVFTRRLTMKSIKVGNDLLMQGGADFIEVDLTDANVDGVLNMIGSTFSGSLNMNRLKVKGDLNMKFGTRFSNINLSCAEIKNTIDMTGSVFSGGLNMRSIIIGNDLNMQNGAEFNEKVILTSAKITSNLNISGSLFTDLDLTDTRINGEFCLYRKEVGEVKWTPSSKLTLVNTNANSIRDNDKAWPNTLELDGFTYVRFIHLDNREVSNFIRFLEKAKLSPQPYRQLSKVMRSAGKNREAVKVLYAGKERERKGAKFPKSLGFFALKAFIGYGIGYRYFYSLVWVLFFIGVGTFVLHISGEHTRNRIPFGIAYSLDMILPIIQLNEFHYKKVEIKNVFVRWYFYFHKIMGYVLAYFLVAGLSGFTNWK